ncbi:MAG: OB-fold nucleic acid binding domain-containing protein, partial [Thermoplasmata archaeon]
MLGLKFGHVAIIFGVLGIAFLYVVTVLSQPIQIEDFTELEHYEGEVVSVEGTILNSYTTSNGEQYYTLYKNEDLLDVIIENNKNVDKNAQVNSIVSVTGEVQKNYRGEYELVGTDGKSLKVVGQCNPPDLNWTNVEFFNNTYVQTAGTVIDIEDYYGDKQKLKLKSSSDTMSVIVLDPTGILGIGDNIEIKGIIRQMPAEYRLYIYSSSAITITGHWDLESVSLFDLTSAPEKYLEFPINVQGVVRYEPWTNPTYSFYLSDSAVDSEISIRVDLSELPEGMELHKGDSVALVAYTAFDKALLRYYLTPIAIEVTQRHGEWQLGLDELAASPVEYERAELNLSGYIDSSGNDYFVCNRARLENSSISLSLAINQ